MHTTAGTCYKFVDPASWIGLWIAFGSAAGRLLAERDELGGRLYLDGGVHDLGRVHGAGGRRLGEDIASIRQSSRCI